MSKNNTYNKENHLKQSDNNLISDNLIQDEEQFLKEYKSDKNINPIKKRTGFITDPFFKYRYNLLPLVENFLQVLSVYFFHFSPYHNHFYI